MHKEREVRTTERINWAYGCKRAHLKIVSCSEAKSWWDDYSYRYRNAPNSLILEMNSDQKTVSPNQTIVKVDVSQYIYDRLKERNKVRVYYMPESPLTFLLQEEI